MADVLVLVESNTTGTGRLFAERARDLGLEPVMVCADPARYPYLVELGVAVFACDTTSLPTVLDRCRGLAGRHSVAGVTSSSEMFIVTAAHVARALGLPGEDPETLAAARSKATQRERFATAGVDSPAYQKVCSAAAATAAADRLGFPVVVKPISRSGSIGVRRCDSRPEVAEHAAALLATVRDERGNPLAACVLVESYLAGPEFSVETMDGEVRAVVAKHLDQSRGFLEIGHDVPAAVDDGTRALLAGSARAALRALGLRWGAAHVELRVAHGRACVVEVNPRLAGGMIPQAVLAATGQDLIAELVARSAGRRCAARPAAAGCASIRFVVPSGDGEIRAVPDASAALNLPGVVATAVTARAGQRVARDGSFLDRVGYVIATGDTPRQAAERADRAVASLAVPVVPV
jgi:argininosuccinate lyase